MQIPCILMSAEDDRDHPRPPRSDEFVVIGQRQLEETSENPEPGSPYRLAETENSGSQKGLLSLADEAVAALGSVFQKARLDSGLWQRNSMREAGAQKVNINHEEWV